MQLHLALNTSAAALILTTAPTCADSTGFLDHYAPKTWTITGAGLGGSSALFAADGSELILTSADGGFGATTKVTHTILVDGIWSFDWSFYTLDCTPGFELGYYTLNGVKYDISLGGTCFGVSGHLDVPVVAGDVIGWQVVSVDGIFGPGYLTITDFRAPVPTPAAFALLSFAAMPRARRRSG